MKKYVILILFPLLVISGCQKSQQEKAGPMTFKEELEFLEKYTDAVVLTDSTGMAKVLASAALQGRVFTSTANGDEGICFGWINHELISSGRIEEHINVYGGEDRVWLGPEGGQFSIFFKDSDPFDLEHWYTPAAFDTEAFELLEQQKDRVVFQKSMSLTNYSDTKFEVDLTREVRVLEKPEIETLLGMEIPENVKKVAYLSSNTIKNAGDNPWTKETGLLSIWILGMYNPSPLTTIVVPFIEGDEQELGPIVNDAYFGKVPSDRLKIQGNVIYFKGDGLYRSKIGLSPQRSKPVCGSYDAGNNLLTIVTFTKPEEAVDYVNSMWELQEKPFAGDVVNSYNDGPPEPGAKPLGPFYELETSSPAAALAPGETLTHEHRTFHFQGEEVDLETIVQKLLGVSLEQIKAAFNQT